MLESGPALFLDRDGTLMEEVHYCGKPGLVRVFPGTGEILAAARERGFRCVIITNQSGIGRGYFTVEDFELVQQELVRQLVPGAIDAVYFCGDDSRFPSERRKPAPAMILEAARDLNIDLSRSWMIGDKAIDVACGRNAGVRTILVETGYGSGESGRAEADFTAKDIVGAVGIVLKNGDE